MKNKSIKVVLHFLFLFIMVQLSLTTLHAQENIPEHDRMAIIDREMNCIQEKINQEEELQWTDVCYTDAYTQRVESKKQAFQEPMAVGQGEETIQLAQASDDAFVYMEDSMDSKPMGMPPQKENIFEAGFEGSHIVYEEPGLMNEKGNMYGVFINYTHRSRKNKVINHIKEVFHDPNKINVYKFEAKLSGGDLDYDSQGTGSSTGNPNYMFEVRGMIGYDLNFTNQMRFTPYMGLGYRYLRDDSGGGITTTGHFAYDREANYFYAPIGLQANRVLVPGWILDAILEYDLFISGEQKSHLGDVSTSYETLTNNQHRGYGIRGSLRLTKETEKMNFFIEPFVRYWDIADSEVSPIVYSGVVVGAGLEPENNSTEYGIKLGLQF